MKLSRCFFLTLFIPLGQPTFAADAPACPSLEVVRRSDFESFRRYDRGEVPNEFAYDATTRLRDGWVLRMQFYSTTPSTVAKANAMKKLAGEPVGPYHGGEGMKWFCTYGIPDQAGITMVSLITEMW